MGRNWSLWGVLFSLGATPDPGCTAAGAANLPLVADASALGPPTFRALPLAGMATMATDRLLGRDTAGTGAVEEISVGGGLEFTGGPGIQRSALTGDATASAGSGALTIANDAVTYAKMQNVSAASRLLGRGSAAGSGDPQELTVSGNLSISGTAVSAASRAVLPFTTVSITLDAILTNYFGFYVSATETLVEIPCPFAGTLKNLHVLISTAAGVGNSYIFTLRKNEASTALTCTIAGAADVQASDLSNTVSVSQGDRLAIESNPISVPGVTAAVAMVELLT